MKMTKKIFSILLVVLMMIGVSGSVRAQEVEWVRQFGGELLTNTRDVVVDSDGNVYVVGLQRDDLLFGDQAYIRKYNNMGDLLWVKLVGDEGNDKFFSVAVGENGNVYVVGLSEAFLLKLDGMGNEIWSISFDGTPYEVPTNVVLDVNENVYISGYVREAFPGQIWYGMDDGFIRKFDFNGNEIWTNQYGTFGKDTIYDFAVDDFGSVYVLYYTGNNDRYNSEYLMKLDSLLGEMVWMKQIGEFVDGLGFDVESETVLVDSVGDVYVGGREVGGYVRKYSPDGIEIWSNDVGVDGMVREITVDQFDDIYIMGMNGSPPLSGEIAYGYNDIFVGKISGDVGVLFWNRQIGGSGNEDPLGIAVSEMGKIVVVGNTGSLLYDPSGTGEYQFSGYLYQLYQIDFGNKPPLADSGLDQVVDEGDKVILDGLGSTDPDGIADIVSYNWDFGDGSVGSGVATTHTYVDNGVYTAILTVMDMAGEVSSDTVAIAVNNVAPTATLLVSENTILFGELIDLSFGNQYDPGVVDMTAGFTYSYDCEGDGVYEVVDILITTNTCAYSNSGLYASKGKIVDKDGGYSEYTVVVTVQTPAEAIDGLIADVESMNLQQGIDNSLDAKLDSALNALDDLNENNDQAAINSLQAFINAVEAQRGSKITDEQADYLVSSAQAIIDSLL